MFVRKKFSTINHSEQFIENKLYTHYDAHYVARS